MSSSSGRVLASIAQMPEGRLVGLTPRWKLLAALVLVLLLAGLSAFFGLHRLAMATDAYAALVGTTMAAAKQADDVNALFITRHKVLKDVYLYATDPARVDQAASEVAGYDAQIDLRLGQLQKGSVLEPDEAQLVDTALAVLLPYRAASREAVAVVKSGGEPFQVQQAAANLTYLKDRPISAALSGLSQQLNARARRQSAALQADVARTIPIVTSVVVLALLFGLFIGLYALVKDNAERLRAEAALQHQARHDALTGLPNRLLFLKRLAEVFNPSSAGPRRAAILMLDLNRFKEVNDTLGHQFGDVLLQHVAQRLGDALRPTDTLARLGGDEFAVLLCGATVESAEHVAHKLLEVLELPFMVAEHSLDIGASIGIVLVPEHGADPTTLLRRADLAMYAAKTAGGRYVVYANSLDAEGSSRLALASELRRAIERDELRLHFQPRVDMRTGKVAGAEALVRWQHPQRGLISPDEFIPLAEQTGLIKPLTRWVLRAALEESRRWRATGLTFPVAVNLSMRNLQDPDLVATIDGLLGEGRAGSGVLDLELTETAVMADIPQSLETLGQLQSMGITIAIDDFGTGYSSLAYLKRLPVSQIKIDRGFVTDLLDSPEDAAVVRAIIDLGHSLGHRVVAEGVEDQATWDWLTRAGCDEAQGYLISRPVPAGVFEGWLRSLSGDSLERSAA